MSSNVTKTSMPAAIEMSTEIVVHANILANIFWEINTIYRLRGQPAQTQGTANWRYILFH